MPPVDPKIEVELALKNTASAAVQDIFKDVSELVKHVHEMGKASSGTDSGIEKTVKGIKGLKDRTDDSHKSFSQLAAILAPMVGVGGTIALVATAFAGAAFALDEFGKGRISLQNLAVDLGLSVDEMSVMEKTFRLMGIPADDAKSTVVAIGALLKNIQTYGERTEAFKNVSFMGERGAAFMKNFLETIRSGPGGEYKGFLMVLDEYNKLIKDEGLQRANQFLKNFPGVSESAALKYREKSKDVEPSFKPQIEAIEKLHQRIAEVKSKVNNAKNRLMDWILLNQRALQEYVHDLLSPKPLAPPGFNERFGIWPGTPFGRGGQQFGLDDKPASFKDRFGDFDLDIKKESNDKLKEILDSTKRLFPPVSPRQFGGSVEAGQSYLVGERGPELFAGGGDSELVGAGGPETIKPKSSGMIQTLPESRAIDDRRGESSGWGPANSWLEKFAYSTGIPQAIIDMHNFRRNNPVAKWLYGEDYGLNNLRLPLAEPHGLGSPGPPDTTEIWSNSDWEQFKRGQTPGSATGKVRSISPSSWWEREQLDQSLRSEESGSNLSAEITFRNVPPGVMTNADGDGFDNFKINKSKAIDF